MTVSVANTTLSDSFNSWRLNTNFAATVISNNVVTVTRAGSAQRGGAAKGNGHVSGTFSATNLRTSNLKGGNTTSGTGGALTIASNTTINASELIVSANATFTGNVDFVTSGADRVILGDVSRLRVTGGSQGQFLRIGTQSDTPDFKAFTLRDVSDLSTNSAHIILSGANTTFNDNGDSTHLIFGSGVDRVHMYLAKDVTAGDSDLYVNLVDAAGDSAFTIADSANSRVAFINSDGKIFSGDIQSNAITANGHILPGTDDTYDIGASGTEWRDGYFDGTLNTDILSVATGASQGVAASLIPVTDAAGNLGSTTRKWGTVWADATNGGAGTFSGLGVSGNFNANGTTTVASITASSLASLDGGIDVDGAFTVADTTGNISTSGTLTVSSTTNLNGAVNLGDASTDTITVKGNFANQSTTGLAQFNGSVNIGDATSDTLTITARVDSDVVPVNNDGTGQYDLGSTANRWHQVYANNVYANNLVSDNDVTVNGTLTVNGTTSIGSGQTFSSPIGRFTNVVSTTLASFEGDTDIGNADTDTLTITAKVDSSIIPSGTVNLGSATDQWNSAWFTGTLTTDTLTVDENASITGTLTVTNTVDLNSSADISGKLSNDGTTIIGSNGKLHANNTISNDTITNGMIQYANLDFTVTDGATKVTSDVKALGSKVQLDSGEGLTWSKAANGAYTIAGENATTSNKGIASFSSSNFSVSSGVVTIKDGGIVSAELANTMNLGAGGVIHGSASQVPIIRVNKQGQVIGISNTSVAGVTSFSYTAANNDLEIGTATGVTYNATISDATTSVKGVASFDSGDFDVSSGAVSLKNAATGAVLAINGTANEVNVSRSNGTVTVGLPDDVTVAGQLNVGENVVISGNLTVNGTQTVINTETLTVDDNIIVLNDNATGSPTADAGIEVERGDATNVRVMWDESQDRWTFTNNGTLFYNIPISSEYDNYSSWTIQDGNANTSNYTVTSADVLQIDQGNGIDSTITADDVLTITNIKPFDNIGIFDGDGTLVTVTNQKYVKFVEGTGDGASIDINWTDTDNGTSGDPYDLSLAVTNTDKGSDQNIFKTITVTDTDSGYTWADTGSVIADTNFDTVTLVSGTGVDIDADATNDAIRIEIGQAVATTSDVQFRSVDVGVISGVGANGQIRATNDIVAHYSDERLKTIGDNIPDALAKVNALSGFYFVENETAKELGYNNANRQVGVSAQQVNEILPEVVKPAPVDDKYLTVQYEKLVPLLIEAIKELSAEVEKLKQK